MSMTTQNSIPGNEKRAVSAPGLDAPEFVDSLSPAPRRDDDEPEDKEENAIQDGTVSTVSKVGMAALGFGGSMASVARIVPAKGNFGK